MDYGGMSQEKDIFLLAFDVPVESRAEFLQATCGGNETLQRAVETLLEMNTRAGEFLESPALEQLAGNNSAESQHAAELLFLTPSSESGALGRLDHYEVLEIIGRGGMAIVMRAHDTKLQREVAVKVLVSSGVTRQSFVREARAVAAIRDDHVVTIHGVADEGPVPYLVMEFINGGTLEELLRNRGCLEVDEILAIGTQIASGLAAAHRKGLIHRDVKPSNVLIESEPKRVKLSDFGVAGEVDGPGTTQTGILVGTPNYMSPEQANGETMDARSDLFSLGSVLYEMCTGKRPFDGPSTVAVLRRVSDDIQPPAYTLNHGIPEELSGLIDGLLSKSAANRPSSAEEVAVRLQEIQTLLTSGPAASTRPQRTLTESAKTTNWWQPVGGLRRVVLAATLMVLGLAAAEASGVTQLGAIIVRLTSTTGNLVIEIEDPDARVSIDGTEVTVSGEGSHDVELRAGDYTIRTSREGEPDLSEIVTIERRGNRVVRIHRESPQESLELPVGLVLKHSLVGHLEQISSLTYSHDGKLLASGDDFGKVRVWNTLDGTLRYHLPELGTPVSGITFSPDSKYLLTSMTNDGSEGEYPIYIWDASTGEPQGELRQHKRGIFSLSFSADGKKLLSAGWEPKLFVWDFSARTLENSTPSPTGDWVRSATYSPTGQIAVASGNLVFLIPPDGQVSPPLHQGDGPISFFSPDGSRLAATWWREGSVHVWDVETRKQLGAWKAHDGKINSAAFSNDKRILATCGNDRAIRVWNVETQTLLAEEVSVSRVYWLEFSPDGKTLAAGGIDDRLVKLWDVSLPEPTVATPVQK